MIHKVRPIGLAELRRLYMAHPDFADSGWAVVQIVGDDETVVDWFADKYAAQQAARELDGTDGTDEEMD